MGRLVRMPVVAFPIAITLMHSKPAVAQGPFIDVPVNHPAAAAVSELAKRVSSSATRTAAFVALI